MKKISRNRRPAGSTRIDDDTPLREMILAPFAGEQEDFAERLEALRAEWRPADPEMAIVRRMARIQCRLGGFTSLENQILRKNMEVRINQGETPGAAFRLAMIDDSRGPRLLDKLSRCRARLKREFDQCVRILQGHAAYRKRNEEEAAARLAKAKPCTNVIQ